MTRKSLFINLCCVICIGLFYNFAATSQPTGQADADELTISAYLYSLPHPPGYPLFITISHPIIVLLSHMVPVSHAANILAGWYAALTIVVLYHLTAMIISSCTKNKHVTFATSVLSTGIIAFSYHFWLYSTIFEIYTFSALCAVVTIYACFRWYYFHSSKWYCASWIAFGILISHIQLGILLLPGWILMQWLHYSSLTTKNIPTFLRQNFLGSILATCVFFGINVLLFAQNQNRLNSWGMTPTFQGWIVHITRQDYSGINQERNGTLQTAIPKLLIDGQTIQSVIQYVRMIYQSTSPFALLLLLFSCIHSWKTHRRLATIISTWFLCAGIFLASYMRLSALSFEPMLNQGIGERQYSLSLIPIALLIAIGVVDLFEIIFKHAKRPLPIIIFITSLILGYQIWNHQSVYSQKQSRTIAYLQAKNRLNSIEPNALIICSTDIDCYSLFYVQDIEHLRPDVIVLPHKPVYKLSQIVDNKSVYPYTKITADDFLPLLIAWNVTKRPTYLTSGINYYTEYIGLETGPFYLQPMSSLFKIRTELPKAISVAPLPSYLSIPTDTHNKYEQGIRESIGNSLAYAGYLALRYQQPSVANDFLRQATTIDDTNRQTYKIINEQQQIMTYMAATNPQSAIDYLKLAQKAENDQQLQSAEMYLRYATYKDPQNIQALQQLRDFYQKNALYQQASEISQHLGIMSTVQ